MFAATPMGGMSFAFPDVCKTPAPPAPPIPIPYPNMAQWPMANPGTAATKVKILNMPALVLNSATMRTNGDEPGVAGGVISSMFGDQCAFKLGVMKVLIEGKPCATLLKMTGHNGMNANMPAGTMIAPSQAKVMVMG